jgi:predicted DsbA family dithiol-disulfide isomerase
VSSLSSHLFLCAVRHLERESEVAKNSCYDLCRHFRKAFFERGRDIANKRVQCELAEEQNLALGPIEAALDSGHAHATLAGDFDLVRRHDVTLSPSLVLNEGRQRLNGNVGYRVIEANVRELLHSRTTHEASWC